MPFFSYLCPLLDVKCNNDYNECKKYDGTVQPDRKQACGERSGKGSHRMHGGKSETDNNNLWKRKLSMKTQVAAA